VSLTVPTSLSRVHTWTVQSEDGAVSDITSGGALGETPVVFIHGWGAPPRVYRTALQHLSSDGYTVIAPHLPGFGQAAPLSRELRGDMLAAYAETVNEQWSYTCLRQPTPIIAHSMGAGVAVKLALMYPQLVSQLVLVCPMGGGGGVRRWGTMAASFLQEMGAVNASPAFTSLPGLLRHPVSAAQAALATTSTDLVPELARAAQLVPTTIIVADQDGVVVAGDLVNVPGIDVVTVKGHHGWMIHEPELFAANVKPALVHALDDQPELEALHAV
jgi:pimeloyl-ACP methyl ester carboxylesterase